MVPGNSPSQLEILSMAKLTIKHGGERLHKVQLLFLRQQHCALQQTSPCTELHLH